MPIPANWIPVEEPLYSEIMAAIPQPEEFLTFITELQDFANVFEYGEEPAKKKYVHLPDCHLYEWPPPQDPPQPG